MNASNRQSRTVDRIAVIAIFAVAILILTTFTLTARSSLQPIPAAVTIALATPVGVPVSDMIKRAASAWSR